jgi:putative IMPACT (imprinted ancient) family translation regulator
VNPATSYLTVARDAQAEVEVKRSRFLCAVRRVEDEVSARQLVDSLRKQHWDARHHCSAFVLGPSGSVQRSSDDGEPAGTLSRQLVHEHLLEVGHADAGRVESELRSRGVEVLDVRYGAGVALLLGVRSDEQEHVHGLVAELTSGRAGLVPGRERWVDRR